MKKSDLRTGMIVELRNGKRYVVLLHTGLGDEQENILRNKMGWEPLSKYDEDMYHKGSLSTSGWDIVRIWEANHASCVGVISKSKEVYGPNIGEECIFDL